MIRKGIRWYPTMVLSIYLPIILLIYGCVLAYLFLAPDTFSSFSQVKPLDLDEVIWEKLDDAEVPLGRWITVVTCSAIAVTSGLLLFRLVWLPLWRRSTNELRRRLNNFFGEAKLSSLKPPGHIYPDGTTAPEFHFLTMDLADRALYTFSNLTKADPNKTGTVLWVKTERTARRDDNLEIKKLDGAHEYLLAGVVTASACFPQVFTPYSFKSEKRAIGAWAAALSDGGIHDNTCVSALKYLQRFHGNSYTRVYSSTATPRSENPDRQYRSTLSRLVRVIGIMLRRQELTQLAKDSTTDICNDASFYLFSLDRELDNTDPGFLDRDIRNILQITRTDFNAFTPFEIGELLFAGYYEGLKTHADKKEDTLDDFSPEKWPTNLTGTIFTKRSKKKLKYIGERDLGMGSVFGTPVPSPFPPIKEMLIRHGFLGTFASIGARVLYASSLLSILLGMSWLAFDDIFEPEVIKIEENEIPIYPLPIITATVAAQRMVAGSNEQIFKEEEFQDSPSPTDFLAYMNTLSSEVVNASEELRSSTISRSYIEGVLSHGTRPNSIGRQLSTTYNKETRSAYAIVSKDLVRPKIDSNSSDSNDSEKATDENRSNRRDLANGIKGFCLGKHSPKVKLFVVDPDGDQSASYWFETVLMGDKEGLFHDWERLKPLGQKTNLDIASFGLESAKGNEYPALNEPSQFCVEVFGKANPGVDEDETDLLLFWLVFE